MGVVYCDSLVSASYRLPTYFTEKRVVGFNTLLLGLICQGPTNILSVGPKAIDSSIFHLHCSNSQ